MGARKVVVMALGSFALLIAPAHAITGVLCIKATGKGTVKARNPVCKTSEVQVGSFDTDAPKASFAASCTSDAVPVGKVCVDKYEASVWETTDAALIDSIRKGEAALVDLGGATQHGAASDDYGAGCPDTANGCTDFYAASVPGTAPAVHLTWFQAAAACRNAGKRLATNQEWQMAALGTPDPGTDNGSTDCNVGTTLAASNTGSRSLCVSNTGAFDMIGNVWEWVADWGDLATACTSWGSTYDNDHSCVGGDGSANLPGGMMRGASFGWGADAGVFALYGRSEPSGAGSNIGFRCAREP